MRFTFRLAGYAASLLLLFALFTLSCEQDAISPDRGEDVTLQTDATLQAIVAELDRLPTNDAGEPAAGAAVEVLRQHGYSKATAGDKNEAWCNRLLWLIARYTPGCQAGNTFYCYLVAEYQAEYDAFCGIIIDPCDNVICPPGSNCINGNCVEVDPCQGVSCPPGTVCDRGNCVATGSCLGVLCGPGTVCENGICVPYDGGPCDANGNCPSGFRCALGECIPL